MAPQPWRIARASSRWVRFTEPTDLPSTGLRCSEASLMFAFVRSKRPTSPLDLDTWEPQRPYIDLSFGVEIGKTYHVRLGIKFSRPKEAVVDDDEDLEGFEWSKQVCVWCIPLATSGRNLTLGAFAACIDDHVVYRSRGTPSGTERRCRSGDSS